MTEPVRFERYHFAPMPEVGPNGEIRVFGADGALLIEFPPSQKLLAHMTSECARGLKVMLSKQEKG